MFDPVQLITHETFLKLKPYYRGFMVYWSGADPGVPGVPDEKNPYTVDSDDWKEWNRGNFAAMLAAQDGEE